MMFPKKNMVEYDNEMQRLYQRTKENDAASPFTSSIFQSPIANRSSSSAESTSPENYFDFQFNQPDIYNPISNPTQPYETLDFSTLFETPQRNEPHRLLYEPRIQSLYNTPKYDFEPRPAPRKILGRSEKKSDTDFGIWQMDNTPPSSYSKDYELFPREEKEHTLMPNSLNFSPICNPIAIQNNFYKPDQMNMTKQNFKPYQNYMGSQEDIIRQGKVCSFCRKNGETPVVYTTHCVKEKIRGQHVVTCPILRSHVCEVCGVSGDNAHTITYCPILRRRNDGKPLKSTTITLKNTPMKSNGRRRF